MTTMIEPMSRRWREVRDRSSSSPSSCCYLFGTILQFDLQMKMMMTLMATVAIVLALLVDEVQGKQHNSGVPAFMSSSYSSSSSSLSSTCFWQHHRRRMDSGVPSCRSLPFLLPTTTREERTTLVTRPTKMTAKTTTTTTTTKMMTPSTGVANQGDSEIHNVTPDESSCNANTSNYDESEVTTKSDTTRAETEEAAAVASASPSAEQQEGRRQRRRRRRQGQPELWLDLRDTVIHPKAAVDYLRERLFWLSSSSSSSSSSSRSDGDRDGDDNEDSHKTAASFYPDRILLTQDVFQNLIDNSDLYLTCEPDILYQNKKVTTNDLLHGKHDTDQKQHIIGDDEVQGNIQTWTSGTEIFSSSGRGLSFPFGSLVPYGKDVSVAVSDPVLVMDTILSKGRWLVFDNNSNITNPEEEEENLRITAVGDFVAITSSLSTTFTASTAWTIGTDSGLILPATTEETVIVDETTGDGDGRDNDTARSKSPKSESSSLAKRSGGIAVPCRYKSSLMTFASTCRSLTSSSRSSAGSSVSSVTASGILITSQGDADDENDNDDSEIASTELPTAIILPFEVDLWELAVMLYYQ